jgi:P27 family predicted phage terminase small subunit
MAGRRPKPTALKILEGNPGHRPLNLREPKPPKGVPVCQIMSSEKSQVTYAALATQLDAMGVLTTADSSALELLADVLTEYRQARDVVQSKGPTYPCKTKNNGLMNRIRPEVRIAESAMKRALSMLTEFGLTPAARTKVTAAATGEDAEQKAMFGDVS